MSQKKSSRQPKSTGFKQPVAPVVDPVLGELRNEARTRLVGSIRFEGRDVAIHVDVAGEECAASLELARDVARSLDSVCRKARSFASRELFTNYNENWKGESLRRLEDGSMVEVDDPELNRTEFEQRLRVTDLSIKGDSVEFYFDDDGLFAGHAIIVKGSGGTDFTDADVTLFG